MRALCGAIITAGAVIGLGLTAIGIGQRFSTAVGPEVHDTLWRMDKALLFILVFLTCVAVIGLGIAFVGLAYHHYHRHHEFIREHGHAPTH